jgi:Zn-dependent M28 family amino/carboxypeptidase
MSRHGLRAFLVAIVVLVAITQLLGGCSDPPGPVRGDLALGHAREILAHGPRPPASAALRRVADDIEKELGQLGLEPRRDRWTDPTEKIEFENVWVEIPGKDPGRGPVVLLGAHYDSKLCAGHPDPAHNFEFVGAVDSAGACGLLLELARVLRDRPDRSHDIWIAWFDGEESIEFDWNRDAPRALFGSRRFRDQLVAQPERLARLKAMVLLDLIGSKNQKIDRDTLSNSDLLDIFQKAATAMGKGDRMYRWESQMIDDHQPFQEVGIPVIDLIDFRFRWAGDQPRPGEPVPAEGEYEAWWHTSRDTIEQLSAESLEFVGNLVWLALPEIEKRFGR